MRDRRATALIMTETSNRKEGNKRDGIAIRDSRFYICCQCQDPKGELSHVQGPEQRTVMPAAGKTPRLGSVDNQLQVRV